MSTNLENIALKILTNHRSSRSTHGSGEDWWQNAKRILIVGQSKFVKIN